ncbi:MAG: tetratricopeptide repeat protein [Chloroflexi bacterium]|nr:tetratricopeptide repeat protein [Chloroflexota bacterium]
MNAIPSPLSPASRLKKYSRHSRIIILLPLIVLACSLPQRLAATPTAPPAEAAAAEQPVFTPTPLPSPTPPPTPTPLPGARIESGDRAYAAGDWESAIHEYQAALGGSSEAQIQSAALLGLARAQRSAGEAQTALDTLARLVSEHPDAPEIPYAHFEGARALEDLGRFSEAADAYLNYLIQRPGLVDAYLLDHRGDALSAGGRTGEALVDYRAALLAPSFLSAFDIELKIARAHAAVGDYETALGLYQGLFLRAPDDYAKAQLDLLSGQAYTALGRMDEAYAVYQEAVNSYPRAYDSYQALLVLVEAGVPVDELNRGIVDYYAGQYGVAMAAFDRYLQANGPDPAAARYYYGLSLRALGGNQDAIAQWDQVIQNYPDSRFWDDAWEEKAYTQWAFMEQPAQAVATLNAFVAAAPAHPRAGEFLYDAALAAERAGDLAAAADYWERTAALYPAYELAARARFLAGVARYRLGDYPAAADIFQSALEAAIHPEERSAAGLWLAKTQQALGNAEAAAAGLALAASADPTGYYSERARDLMNNRPPFEPPAMFDLGFDLETERVQAEEWMRQTFNIPAGVSLQAPGPLGDDARYQRGAELWRLGLYEEARLEFENLRLSLQADPLGSFLLAGALHRLGLYRSAILSARQTLDAAAMSDSESLTAPAYFQHIRFGPYYAEVILPAANQQGIHPLLLFSLVRQESAFEGFVRSSAGARGLMQIMPATGDEIAAEVGWPPGYTSADLYRPLVSVTLGADYLAKWLNYFEGDVYAALAAYNAGPGNAAQWQNLSAGDPDVLLEVVRYAETRDYIQRVYEIFTIYRRIYNRTP